MREIVGRLAAPNVVGATVDVTRPRRANSPGAPGLDEVYQKRLISLFLVATQCGVVGLVVLAVGAPSRPERAYTGLLLSFTICYLVDGGRHCRRCVL
ncbi:MAG: hypothetical protein QM639_16605 [Rhodocyclaceae bacterium]